MINAGSFGFNVTPKHFWTLHNTEGIQIMQDAVKEVIKTVHLSNDHARKLDQIKIDRGFKSRRQAVEFAIECCSSEKCKAVATSE